MSLTAAALRKMREMGLTADQMVELAEVLEASRPSSAGAQRTRRWRERKADSQTKALTASPRDVTGETLPPPPALDKETPPAPPKEINPTPETLADARGPAAAGVRASGSSTEALKRVADEIWALQPVLGGKRRAARPDVARALATAVRRGGDPAEILACCRAYYALPDCTKEGGRFAKGAADLVAADRWAEYRPAPGAAPAAAAPIWTGPKPVLDAVRAETDDGFVRSYLLTAEWVPPAADGGEDGLLGAIRPRTAYAFDKLSRLERLRRFARLLQPSYRSHAA